MSTKSEIRRALFAPVAAMLLPAYLSACFHYVAMDTGWTPEPGTNVRATLADPIPFNMGTVTVHDVGSIEGMVVESSPDSLGVWVKWLHPSVGSRYDANSAEFYVQRTSIKQLDGWRVAPKRTAVLGVVSVAAVVGMLELVSYAIGRNSDNADTKDPQTIITQVRLPLR